MRYNLKLGTGYSRPRSCVMSDMNITIGDWGSAEAACTSRQRCPAAVGRPVGLARSGVSMVCIGYTSIVILNSNRLRYSCLFSLRIYTLQDILIEYQQALETMIKWR